MADDDRNADVAGLSQLHVQWHSAEEGGAGLGGGPTPGPRLPPASPTPPPNAPRRGGGPPSRWASPAPPPVPNNGVWRPHAQANRDMFSTTPPTVTPRSAAMRPAR